MYFLSSIFKEFPDADDAKADEDVSRANTQELISYRLR